MSKKKFNSPIAFTTAYESINNIDGVLKGVVICEEGEAKGHGVMLNKKFVSDVVTKGKEFGEVGVKSRFGHPNMCSDALGTYLGRFKNFRLRKNPNDEEKGYQAIADLYLDESAKITPHGDLFSYVTKLAETAPDHFGNSIVFRAGDTDYKKKTDEETGEEYEVAYATIEELYESDLVDSPAATNSLFSQFDSSELAYSVTTFLDENPDLFEAIADNPNIIDEFIQKYTQYKSIKMEKKELTEKVSMLEKAIEKLKDMFSKKEEKTEVVEAVIIPEVEKLTSENTTLLAQLSEKNASIEALTNEVAALRAEKETFDAQVKDFEAKKAEILKFEQDLKDLKTQCNIPDKTNVESTEKTEKEKTYAEMTTAEIVAEAKAKEEKAKKNNKK